MRFGGWIAGDKYSIASVRKRRASRYNDTKSRF